MRRGGKPTPTDLKIIKGTAQPCRINPFEPRCNTDRFKAPSGMSKKAKVHWKLVIKELLEARIPVNIDAYELAAYCETYAQWREQTDHVAAHGSVITDSRGDLVANPHFSASMKSLHQLRQMWADFGMTPTSRSKIIATGNPKSDNQFASNGRKSA